MSRHRQSPEISNAINCLWSDIGQPGQCQLEFPLIGCGASHQLISPLVESLPIHTDEGYNAVRSYTAEI